MTDYTDLIGIPFKVHGRSKKEGYDCYGLAMEVLKRNGIYLPEIPYNHLGESDKIREKIFSNTVYNRIDKLEKNCIIEIEYRNLPMHVAVYIGEGKMIHSVIGYGVRIEPVRIWEKRIRGYYKVSNVSNS